MRKVILDCEKLLERRQAHLYLADLLDFPDYYGKNLDALFDCLTELPECTIILQNEKALRKAGGYGVKMLETLREAEKANPGLRLENAETL